MSTNFQLPPKILKSPVSMPGAAVGTSAFRHHIDRIAWSLGMLTCLYLIWPAFHAVHLEGFTAQTQSIALLKSLAPGVEHDPYLPLVSQFIYQTRSAVIDLLGVIYKIEPGAGDLAFRGLVFLSFMILLASSMIFAKRWGGVKPVFSFFALIMTPGIPETAFFFNDNIVSAAFASAAIGLISRKSGKIEYLLSGILLGMAILSRVDAVFIFPMMIGIVFYAGKDRHDRLAAALMICLAAMLVLITSAVVHGFSLIDAFVTAGKFVVSHNDKNNWFWMRIFFFGLSALPFLLIGVWLSFRRLKMQKEYMGMLVFIFYPALLVLFAPKATEVRYIFPILAPVVALHVGTGLHWICRQCLHARGKKLRYAWVTAAFSVLVALSPPMFLKIHDGPRLMLGRLWSPFLWLRWQASVDETMARTKELVAALDNQKFNILLSTHYNDEFYSRLRLMEAGFLPMSASIDYPGCHGFSLFKKGNGTVLHIRTDPQYRIAPVNMAYNAALQISAAFSCDLGLPYSRTYITTFGENEEGIPPEIYAISAFSFDRPLTAEFDDLREKLDPGNSDLHRNHGILDFKVLTPQEIMETQSKAERYLMAHPESDPVTGNIVRIEDYEKYYCPSPGPTGKWLLKIQKKIGIVESKFFSSDACHEK